LAKTKRNILKNILKKSSIVCLTAYTAPMAKLIDEFADIILVGDSLGPVLYGFKSTREVNLDMMIQHAKSVVKNTRKSFVVVDMPFGSYQKSKYDALRNARKIISETGAMAVKIEGGKKFAKTIDFLIQNKIKVMGHLGLLPQSLRGKPKVYGKTLIERNQLLEDIYYLKEAGIFSLVIECTTKSLVDEAVQKFDLPIIGIGASEKCRGQIIVTEDILGMTNFKSKFLKKYLNFFPFAKKALRKFSDDVKKGKYPNRKQCY